MSDRKSAPDDTIVEAISELAGKLNGMATLMCAANHLDEEDVAAAFISVGVNVARKTQGPVQTAEWLRGIANKMEQLALPVTYDKVLGSR